MENSDYKNERFDSYLNKIIILNSKSYFKKQMKIANTEKAIVDDEESESLLQNFLVSSNVLTDLDNFVTNLELNNALKSLSAIEQAVIFLLFNEDFKQEDAAEILKICSRTVRRIKLRAIEKLKKYLKGDVNNE